MTLHTLAIVLKQSVVFSMGRFLFCIKKKIIKTIFFKKDVKRKERMLSHICSKCSLLSHVSLTSDTNLVVPSLNAFSMGVASA